MFLIDEDVFVPMLVFGIPIVAILGGILAGVVRTISSHHLMEVAIRERMALVAHGLDPDKIPSTIGLSFGSAPLAEVDRFRAQSLLVAGFVMVVGGAAVALVDWYVGLGDLLTWPVGVIGMVIGVALLLSGAIIWPKGRRAHGA